MAHTLLLADDSPTIAKILQMALQSEDYSIRAVLTAEEALQELRANPPFLFLCDLNLPAKSGYEFARLIRQDSKLRGVRVVLLASAFEPVDEAEYATCGADCLVKKPFDPSELRAKLRGLVESPAKYPESARVTGSLSGYMVSDPKDSTRTNLTIGGLNTNAFIDTNSDILKSITPAASDPATDLLEITPDVSADGSEADQILAGLLGGSAPPAAPPGDLSSGGGDGEYRPDRTIHLDLSEGLPPAAAPADQVLDLSASFGIASDMPGTQRIELGTHTVNLSSPPASPPPVRPAAAATPSAPPASPPRGAPKAAPAPEPEEPLSANAQALAAFFEAELHTQADAGTPPAPPPRAPGPAEADPADDDAFDSSLDSIDWSAGPADAALNQWSSTATPKPPAQPARPAALPASQPSTLAPTPAPATEGPPAFGNAGAPHRERERERTSPGLRQPAVSASAGERPAGPPPGARPQTDGSFSSREKTSPGFSRQAETPVGRPGAVRASSGGGGGASADASLLFDTGRSTFRFSEDYIQRITKSFTGAEHENVPEEHPSMFPQHSDDRPATVPHLGDDALSAPSPAAPATERFREGGGAWSESDVQKIEQIVREEVQMVVREVAEKIAWEVIPELAENLIRKELEKVLKELGQ